VHSALSATGGRTGLQWSTDAGAQGQVGYELDHGLLELTITARINYTIRSFLTTLFFTNGPVWKHISDLDLLKGAKRPYWINGRSGLRCPSLHVRTGRNRRAPKIFMLYLN
jgi:hypothetical protein